MTGESYNRIPEGRIVVRGEPVTQVEKELTENAIAGMLVTCDGNDYKAKKATSDTMPVGWLAFEYSPISTRPSTYEEEFKTGDLVTVISGGSFDIFALVTGEASTGADVTINEGTLLVSNGDGTLVPYTSEAEYPPVARAMETVVIPKGTGATPNVVRITAKSLI